MLAKFCNISRKEMSKMKKMKLQVFQVLARNVVLQIVTNFKYIEYIPLSAILTVL